MEQKQIKLSEPQEAIMGSSQNVNLFLAGVGSGKTFLISLVSGYFISNFPNVPGFIGANTYMQLSQSTLLRVKTVWDELFGWKQDRDYVVDIRPPKHFEKTGPKLDSYNGVISFASGAIVFKGSLDNAKAHDGKEMGWACLDETKDSREEDVKETIMTRLRFGGIFVTQEGILTSETRDAKGNRNKSLNPLYIFTSPAKVAWLNEWFKLDDMQVEILETIFNSDDYFFKEFEDKCVVISSTYHNEENLPFGFIDRLVKNNTETRVKMLVYGNPFVKGGNEFYSEFKRITHVRKMPYQHDLPVHISFDQNVNPYITATLWQTWKNEETGKTHIHQFAELCLPNPKNRTDRLCMEIIRHHGRKLDAGLFIYGDPSGRKSDTRGLEHDYKIIKRLLRRWLNNKSDRVPYKHPGVIKRRDFINNIFAGVYDVECTIDPSCKKSIADFEFVKEDKNGKKHKETVKDPVTGVRYEKYGHTSDSADYLLCKLFERLFSRHFK